MIERFSHHKSARVTLKFPIKIMMLFVLVTAIAGSAFGQNSSSTSTNAAVASVVAPATTDPAVSIPAPDAAISPETANPKPYPIGAGSENQGYVIMRGYALSIHRSGGDPAIINAAAGGLTGSITNFNYGTKAAYKVEAGWNWSNNFGFRASYFYTNQSAQENRTQTAAAPFFLSPRPLNVVFTGAPTIGTLARFRERFQVHVIDLEGTYKWHQPNWTVLISGGLRFAPSRQTYSVDDTFAGLPETLSYVQERTGIGPTGAIDFRHRIGGSSFWWTGSARVAGLWGDIDEAASYNRAIPTLRTSSRTTWVWEAETGIEWVHKFAGNNEIFLNGSFTVQHWGDIVNVMPTPAIGTSATATLDNPLLPPTRKGSIRMLGGVFSLGFRF